MNRKLIALLIALLVIAFPFRWAFLDYQKPGITMILSFVLTLVGIIAFYYLTMDRKSEQH